MHRQIAGKLTGRVTKWLVLGFWILVVAAAGPLAGKLSDVQDNQASSWLPASAESTKALEKLAPFQDQNDIATVVVYEKSSGLTKADLATIGTPARPDPEARRHDARRRPPTAPRPSPASRCRCPRTAGRPGDGHLQLRQGRLEQAARRQGPDHRHRRARRSQRLRRRARRPGGRLGRGLRRHRRQAALQHGHRGGDRAPADLPQPPAVDPPGVLGRRRPGHGAGSDLPARQERRPHRQRPECRHPHGAGLRRRHRLRPAARGSLPRGAPHPRGPPRGDGRAPSTAPHRRSSPAPSR